MMNFKDEVLVRSMYRRTRFARVVDTLLWWQVKFGYWLDCNFADGAVGRRRYTR
jgi:hypothetical protein